MRLLYISVAVAILLAIHYVEFSHQTLSSFATSKDPIYYENREAKGHFNDENPLFGSLYPRYVDAYIRKTDANLKNIDEYDWRTKVPTGEQCTRFLSAFQSRKYRFKKVVDIVLLDVCLGWLFNEDFKSDDVARMTPLKRQSVEALNSDPKLKEIFDGTHPENWANPKCLASFLEQVIDTSSRDVFNGCSYEWLQIYVQFGRCYAPQGADTQHPYGEDSGIEMQKDTYLKLIHDETKRLAAVCFDLVAKEIPGTLRALYNGECLIQSAINSKRVVKNFIGSIVNKKKTQRQSMAIAISEERKWPMSMIRVLQVLEDSDKYSGVDVRLAAKTLQEFKAGREATEKRISHRLAEYVTDKVNSQKRTDIEGQNRYDKIVRDLCELYIDPGEFEPNFKPNTVNVITQMLTKFDIDRDAYDRNAYRRIEALINMVGQSHVFGEATNFEAFKRWARELKWQPVYLAIVGCRLLTVTIGELDPHVSAGVIEYKVGFMNNIRDRFKDWPLIRFQEVMKVKY